MASTDDILEDKPNNCPWDVVDSCCWWDSTSTREDNWEVDIADEAVRPLERNEPSNQRADRANEEEERER